MAKEQKKEEQKEPQYDTYKRGTADPQAAEATNRRGVLNLVDRLINKPKYFKKGGEMKESKKTVGKEVAFMKKKGAPKSMIQHEEAEMKAMKKGGSTGYRRAADGIAKKGKTRGTMLYCGGMAKKK